MPDEAENDKHPGPENYSHAPHEAVREQGGTTVSGDGTITEMMPSRVIRICMGEVEATPDEQEFLKKNPSYREKGERIAEMMRNMQSEHKSKTNDDGRSR